MTDTTKDVDAVNALTATLNDKVAHLAGMFFGDAEAEEFAAALERHGYALVPIGSEAAPVSDPDNTPVVVVNVNVDVAHLLSRSSGLRDSDAAHLRTIIQTAREA